MKKIALFLIACSIFNAGISQISDSTIKQFSNYICKCIDTVDFNKNEEELRKQFSLCKTISLTNLLNDRLITPDWLTDKTKMSELQEKGLTKLVDNCEKILSLISLLNREPAFDETNADNLFTSPVFFESYGLKKGQTNDRLHVYNNIGEGVIKYQRVVDIRWTFKNEADALKWHEMNLEKNSEGGKPVDGKLSIRGATALKAYREGPRAVEMLKAFGISQRHHYFIFVYKNIVCKVFVATDDKTDTVEAVPFAIAAVDQLESVIR